MKTLRHVLTAAVIIGFGSFSFAQSAGTTTNGSSVSPTTTGTGANTTGIDPQNNPDTTLINDVNHQTQTTTTHPDGTKISKKTKRSMRTIHPGTTTTNPGDTTTNY